MTSAEMGLEGLQRVGQVQVPPGPETRIKECVMVSGPGCYQEPSEGAELMT